jgi:transmembrane sensor
MQEHDIYILILSYLEGNIADKDREYLLKWLASAENKKFFEEVKITWELSQKAKLPLTSDIEKEWLQFKNLRDNQHILKSKIVNFSLVRKRLLQAAAIFLAIFGIYYIYHFSIQRSNYQSFVYTSNSKVLLVHLSDGSSVWLNKISTIHYSSLYKKERKVMLEGEAYFEVAKDITRPFIIQAGSTETRVLGTKFNLKAVAKSNRVELTVVEGKVQFANLKKSTLILKGGEQGIALNDRNVLIKKENTDINLLSWKDSTLIFHNEKVEKVIIDVERYFNVKILYPSDIAMLNFTGEFLHPTLEELISAFSLSLDLDYKINGKTVYLTRK